MYYPLEAEAEKRIIYSVLTKLPEVANGGKPELTTQEMYDIVLWNTNMIKSAIADILVDKVLQRMLYDNEARVISKCPFTTAVKAALDFKFEVGDRAMTEEEVYKYANEIIDERIKRIRDRLSGAFYE